MCFKKHKTLTDLLSDFFSFTKRPDALLGNVNTFALTYTYTNFFKRSDILVRLSLNSFSFSCDLQLFLNVDLLRFKSRSEGDLGLLQHPR